VGGSGGVLFAQIALNEELMRTSSGGFAAGIGSLNIALPPIEDLPDRYPSPSTCWRRLRLWEDQGVWVDVWRNFLSMLDEKGLLDWKEAFIDGSFAPAKKGHLAPVSKIHSCPGRPRRSLFGASLAASAAMSPAAQFRLTARTYVVYDGVGRGSQPGSLAFIT